MALHKEKLVFPHSDILWNVEVANLVKLIIKLLNYCKA